MVVQSAGVAGGCAFDVSAGSAGGGEGGVCVALGWGACAGAGEVDLTQGKRGGGVEEVVVMSRFGSVCGGYGGAAEILLSGDMSC